MSQGQLVFSGAVKSQTAGCSPERLISKSSNSHLRDECFISERRLERPTGGPALQGWRTPRPLVPPVAMWATVWGRVAGVAAAAGWHAVCRAVGVALGWGARSCLENLVGGSWAAPWAGGVRRPPPPGPSP